jgi:hypothetical protein
MGRVGLGLFKRLDDRIAALGARFRLGLSRTTQRDVARFGKLDRPGHRGAPKYPIERMESSAHSGAKRVAWQAIASRGGATKIPRTNPDGCQRHRRRTISNSLRAGETR